MFSLIVAMSENKVIWDKNKLLWNIPEDLKRFKELTLNKKVIMWRKTFESIIDTLWKPLPWRENIVITRNKNYSYKNFDSNSITIESNIWDIIKKYKNIKEEVFIIWWANIYEEFFDVCRTFYITLVHKNFEGDTKLSDKFDKLEKWVHNKCLSLVFDKDASTDTLHYSFLTYKKITILTRFLNLFK